MSDWIRTNSEEVWKFIQLFHLTHDRLPSTREIQREFRYGSQTAAIGVLKKLVREEKIEKTKKGYRFNDPQRGDRIRRWMEVESMIVKKL